MAQTLQQDCKENSTSSDNKLPPNQQSFTSNSNNKNPLKSSRLANRIPKTNRVTTTSTAKTNKSTVVSQQARTKSPVDSTPSSTGYYQASKVFVTKCQTESQLLLNHIKTSYHEEIKNLFAQEDFADFFIQVGDTSHKPLHRCIIASRAFKLYKTLKAFQLVEVPVEEDIIVSNFQTQDQKVNVKEDKTTEESAEEAINDTKGPLTEQGDIFEISTNVHLPDDIFSIELLSNFFRRAYLDQDLTEEENNLNQKIIDWLKLHKPELVRSACKRSPNHKESFRTIQPNYEKTNAITPSTNSPTMLPDQVTNLSDGQDNDLDDDIEQSHASIQDESLTHSLTRTETFELISRNNNEVSPVATPSKNILLDEHESTSGDLETSETTAAPVAYAPTTRTGLKPKTFTTPTNLMSNTFTQNASKRTATSTVKQPSRDSAKSKNESSTKTSINKQPGFTPVAAKRSSLTSQHSESTSQDILSSTPTTKATTNTIGVSAKAKQTLIARAQPISMERSQSPGINVLTKGSTRNFIEANKRFVSQLEKKIVAQNEQAIYDSETDPSETGSYVIEPLALDDLVAQMDKFTLVSHSKLANALSRIFINGGLYDSVVLVKDDKQIKTHRCILAARSAYLEEYISKQHVDSTKVESIEETGKPIMKIDLTDFSYPAVYFCLIHIYSGVVKVPDDLDLDELTRLAHLLHVDSLKQVCMHNLRMSQCHFFHKPCNVCCLGVLKTLPLAWRYDYSELYSKCLQWIGSHFTSIFCLREFSELKPHDLIEECYSATLNQLTPHNIIPKTIECQKLLKNLPRVKWSESTICLVGRLLEDFCHYVADNYEKILQSDSFLNLGKNCWECEILEENLLAAMNHLKPDSGCRTLIQLHKLECNAESYCEDSRNSSDSFANLISKMRKYCERYLLKDAAAVVHCSSWRHMNPSLQKRIRDQAIISTDFDEPTKHLASKPKLASMSRVSSQNTSTVTNSSSNESTRSSSNRSTPESRLKSPSTTYLPPPKNKTAAARHVKVLK